MLVTRQVVWHIFATINYIWEKREIFTSLYSNFLRTTILS